MAIPEIDWKYFLRLESFYSNKYGADNLIIITDSKQVIAGSTRTFCQINLLQKNEWDLQI